MKKNNLLIIILSFTALLSCRNENVIEPLFNFNCSDTTIYFNSSNDTLDTYIKYYNDNLFVRSESSSNGIKYVNYDSKNRKIKEGTINENGHYYIEYIYGEYDTICEVRNSNNEKYLFFYNQNRKMIEKKYFVNNVLHENYFYEYFYSENIEMVRQFDCNGYQYYDFNIHNCAVVTVNLDTIPNYMLRYISGSRIDSFFMYRNHELFIKKIYKFDIFNKPLLEDYRLFEESYSAFYRMNWEYNQLNLLSRFVYERQNTANDNENQYHESVFLYDQNYENYRIDIYCIPNVLCEYVLISKEGNYTYSHNYNANNSLISFTKNSPLCLESLVFKNKYDFSFENDKLFLNKK